MSRERVLVVTGGQFHPFEACGRILKELLESAGEWEAEVTEDRGRFTAMGGLRAVVLYTQGGALMPAQEQGLLDFVRGGGGLVGLHGATASFRSNPAYMEMIGSEFKGHGPPFGIPVEQAEGYREFLPNVDRAWVQPDEFYELELRTNEPVKIVQYGWLNGRRLMLGYARQYGKGRVFYSALGHDESAFRNPNFRALVLDALRWAVAGQ